MKNCIFSGPSHYKNLLKLGAALRAWRTSINDLTYYAGPHGRIIKNDVLSAAKSSKGSIRRDKEEYCLVPNNKNAQSDR